MTEHDTIEAINNSWYCGYKQGYEAALRKLIPGLQQHLEDIVRCKWADLCKDPEFYEYKGANGFCSYGKRKDEVENV